MKERKVRKTKRKEGEIKERNKEGNGREIKGKEGMKVKIERKTKRKEGEQRKKQGREEK